MTAGPDFIEKTKQTLAKRAGQVCSNPDCRRPTSGPHSDEDKALNLGEAAHIKGARTGTARYDLNMTDKERSGIPNGIWLCRECARKIDLDEAKYTAEVLIEWKKAHDSWITAGKPATAGREVIVRDGGTGSIISNEGAGVAVDIKHSGKGPAERITVEGAGVGEIITNSGQGIGKRIVSTGGGTASESCVIVNRPVKMASALTSKLIIKNCDRCGKPVNFSKVIQGFAGDEEPIVEVRCPYCGETNTI
ncbi:hypothetical protein ACFLV0_03785 [Chloroflexota bacterium]